MAELQHQFRDLLLVEGQYGELEAPDINRLKELEHENGRLKRMYADLSLENAALKDSSAEKNYYEAR